MNAIDNIAATELAIDRLESHVAGFQPLDLRECAVEEFLFNAVRPPCDDASVSSIREIQRLLQAEVHALFGRAQQANVPAARQPTDAMDPQFSAFLSVGRADECRKRM